MMKYAMMGAGVRAEIGRIPAAEQERRIRSNQQALNEVLRERVIAGRTGLIFVSVGLGPFHGGEGHTLSVGNRGGRRFRTDRPFPETREVVGGFDIIDFASPEEAIEFGNLIACDSIDEAIDWAEKLTARDGDTIEVRPADGFGWVYHE